MGCSSTGSPCSMAGSVWVPFLLRRDFGRRLRRRFCCFWGNYPSPRPVVPRHHFLLVYPPCIHRELRWLSSALWALVLGRLRHRCPYRRCLRSRSLAYRLSHRQWLRSGWWVGFEFLHCSHPNLPGRSPARSLLIKRETLVNSGCRQRASAENVHRGELHHRSIKTFTEGSSPLQGV